MIEINYQLNNSGINFTKVNYYSELGIDIFNIKDEFFNDICYSYSEHNSDMILNDRISDIYENYSLCENNCKYDKINISDNLVTCKCYVKNTADPIEEPPNLDTIVLDSLIDSNLGVIKCYKLVFSFKNKHQNIGFWIFTVLIFLHIPFFIYYFIFNIKHIKTFIFTEMENFHYLYQIRNPKKKKDDENTGETVQKQISYKIKIKKNILNKYNNCSKKVLIINKNKKINEKGISHFEGYYQNISQPNSKSSKNLDKSELLNINKKIIGKKNNRKELKYKSYYR